MVWFLPTRNRPAAMRKLIASMRATGDVPHVAVMIDGPEEPYADIDWPDNWDIEHSSEHLELQRAFNRLLYLYPGEKTYGTLVDHCEFYSPGWATKLEAEAGDWNIAFCEDAPRLNARTGFPRMNAATCFGGKLIENIGWVYPNFCVHLAGDDAWEEIGWELGIVKQPKDTFVKALFFVRGEFPYDQNHDRIFRGKSFAHSDMDAFYQWQKTDKPRLLAKLNAIIPDQCRGTPRVAKKIEPVTVCCVNAGNYQGRGAEYVNNLHDMVRRNLPYGFVGNFVCFTDDAAGLNEGIEARPLPVQGLDGWWNKLALFKAGVFAEGSRVWFVDLDTLIIGPLEEIFAYQGDFATLRDFYFPENLGPAIISWRVGKASQSIWDEWDACGRPKNGHGDLWWINRLDQGRFAHRADRLQNIFPDKFVSFKAHCQPYPPSGAAVICFHGEPRPHNCETEWVSDVWKIGGMTTGNVMTFCNASDSQLAENILHSSARDLTWLSEQKPNSETALIVGGGPSLADSLDEIRMRVNSGQHVFALNGAAKFLAAHNVPVRWQVIMDAKASNADFISQDALMYLFASQVSPNVFDAVNRKAILLFHAKSIYNMRDILPKYRGAPVLVGGGTTILTRAMVAVHLLGYRHQHIFGADSSFRGDEHHAYEQTINDGDKPSAVTVGGVRFMSCPWMMAQVNEFQTVAAFLANQEANISVHGDGLLPQVARLMITEQAA